MTQDSLVPGQLPLLGLISKQVRYLYSRGYQPENGLRDRLTEELDQLRQRIVACQGSDEELMDIIMAAYRLHLLAQLWAMYTKVKAGKDIEPEEIYLPQTA